MKKIVYILGVLMLIMIAVSVSAWWDGSWGYKKELNLTHTDHINEPILYNLSYICTSNCNSNYSDIRVVDDDTNTTLPFEMLNSSWYWRESATDPVYLQFIVPDATSNISIYYGNPDADYADTKLFNFTYLFVDNTDFVEGTYQQLDYDACVSNITYSDCQALCSFAVDCDMDGKEAWCADIQNNQDPIAICDSYPQFCIIHDYNFGVINKTQSSPDFGFGDTSLQVVNDSHPKEIERPFSGNIEFFVYAPVENLSSSTERYFIRAKQPYGYNFSFMQSPNAVTNNFVFQTQSWWNTGVAIEPEWMNLHITLGANGTNYSLYSSTETENTTPSFKYQMNDSILDVIPTWYIGKYGSAENITFYMAGLRASSDYDFNQYFEPNQPNLMSEESSGCTPDWLCSAYGTCLINDTQNCVNVTDNNLCGENYTGNFSEFSPNACDYCTPTWSCSLLGNCSGVVRPCLNVSDSLGCYNLTNLSSDLFAGNISLYDVNCSLPPTGYVAADVPYIVIDFIGTIPVKTKPMLPLIILTAVIAGLGTVAIIGVKKLKW